MKFFEKYVPGNRQTNMHLLWEYNTEGKTPMDFRNLLVARTIEMGREEDFYAAFDLVGGIDEFAKIVRDEITGLNPKDLNFVCHAFNLKKEETLCYRKQQLRKAILSSSKNS